MIQFVNEREVKKSESVRKFFLKAWQGLLDLAGIHMHYRPDHKHLQSV